MGHENGGWMNDDQRSATRDKARTVETIARRYLHGKEQCLTTDPADDGTYALWNTEERRYLRRSIYNQEAKLIALDMPYITDAGRRYLGIPADRVIG